MLSIKNPKALYVRGDYNLVKCDEKIVAIIFCSREQTCRRSYQGYNDWAIFDWIEAPGYEVLTNKPINVPLGKYCGEDIGITVCKLLPTRHAYADVHAPLRKENIVIEEYSSIVHPLAVAWEYTWHNHASKKEEYRNLSLCDHDAEGLPRAYDIFQQDPDEIEFGDWTTKFIPSFLDLYKSAPRNYVQRHHVIVSRNNNFLVHDEEIGSYTWYTPGGTAIKYTDRGEYEYLSDGHCDRQFGGWIALTAREMGVELPEPDETPTEAPVEEAAEAPVERRERRQRSGSRRKFLEATETPPDPSEASETSEE